MLCPVDLQENTYWSDEDECYAQHIEDNRGEIVATVLGDTSEEADRRARDICKAVNAWYRLCKDIAATDAEV